MIVLELFFLDDSLSAWLILTETFKLITCPISFQFPHQPSHFISPPTLILIPWFPIITCDNWSNKGNITVHAKMMRWWWHLYIAPGHPSHPARVSHCSWGRQFKWWQLIFLFPKANLLLMPCQEMCPLIIIFEEIRKLWWWGRERISIAVSQYSLMTGQSYYYWLKTNKAPTHH